MASLIIIVKLWNMLHCGRCGFEGAVTLSTQVCQEGPCFTYDLAYKHTGIMYNGIDASTSARAPRRATWCHKAGQRTLLWAQTLTAVSFGYKACFCVSIWRSNAWGVVRERVMYCSNGPLSQPRTHTTLPVATSLLYITLSPMMSWRPVRLRQQSQRNCQAQQQQYKLCMNRSVTCRLESSISTT